MANADIRMTIAEVLNVENSMAWEIVSEDPEHNLYMIHHKQEANLNEYGNLRGIVVDVTAKTVVCRSNGHTPIVVSDKLNFDDAGKMKLVDTMNNEHVVDDKTNFKIGFEGTLITVFKHNGKVYRTTKKRLDPTKSRWGNSKTFMDIYWELGGPTDEELFDPESKYSPFCHMFIMVHPDVMIVSKNMVGSGYLVYLGHKQMYDLDYTKCPYKQTLKDGSYFSETETDFELDGRLDAGWIENVPRKPKTSSQLNSSGTIYEPENISLDIANKHLEFGFYPAFDYQNMDGRLLPGEFVIIETPNYLIKVESTSYAWRSSIRDNNPNLLHRFFQLLNGSYIQYDTPEGKLRYDNLYVTLTPYSEESIKSNNDGFIVWPQDYSLIDDSYLHDRDSRMYNIWLNFLSAVPPHKQKEVNEFYSLFYKKREIVISWLQMLDHNNMLDSTILSKRAIDIIKSARQFTQNRIVKKQDRTKNGKKLTMQELNYNNIRNLVMKEQGTSLYRLAKERDNYYKEMSLKTE